MKVVDRWEMTAESHRPGQGTGTYWARRSRTVTKLSVDGLATALKKKVPGQSLGRRGHGPATWTTGTPGLMARAEPDPTPTKVRRNTTVRGGEYTHSSSEPVKPAEAAEVVAAVEAAPLQLRDHFATVSEQPAGGPSRGWPSERDLARVRRADYGRHCVPR